MKLSFTKADSDHTWGKIHLLGSLAVEACRARPGEGKCSQEVWEKLKGRFEGNNLGKWWFFVDLWICHCQFLQI
jgi:tRNA uridine 5-carbamoylmethylation protein Kti12